MEIKNYKGILFFDEKGSKDTLLAKGNDFQEVVLKTENYHFIQPINFSENYFTFKSTKKAENEFGNVMVIYLEYDKGIIIVYRDNTDFQVKEDYITDKDAFYESMSKISKYLRQNISNDFATEVSLISIKLSKLIWETKEINTNFVKDKDMPEETPKIGLPSTSPETWNGTFKVGDKVKVRWDFSKDLGGGASKVEYNSIENNFTITKIDKQQATPYKEDKNGNNIGGFMRKENPSGYLYVLNNGEMWEGKDLELLDFKEEKPEQTPYEQIDFLSPSTEELDTVIKSMNYNSDGLTFIDSRKATVLIGEIAISVNFINEKGNNRISIVKKDLTGKLFESPIIKNESLLEIQEIYYNLLKQVVDYLEETPDKTPEITPFQQISFLNPSTEENDVLIKTMSYYSDGLTFENSTLANLKFKLKDRIASLEVLFDKVNNIIKISEPSKNIQAWSTEIQGRIKDENITEITNLYFKTLEKFIEKAEGKTPPKPEPKFKVGDKVKFPTSRDGKEIESFIIDDAKADGKKYLVIDKIENDKFFLKTESSDDILIQYNIRLELYEETLEKPAPKFKIGDRVTFNKMPFDTFRVMEDPKYNSEKGKFVYRLANEDGKSSFSASYEDEMNLIVVETPMDCDADPTKIVSGQVKAFYDLNKNRIDKLNSKFSCKIIKALVSLSDYEKCGSPSSVTVTKAKTDLLSKISKLKV
jgi:transcription antitermination factor NusG